MADYNITVLTQALNLWPQDSEEVKLLREAKASKAAERETLLAKLALRNRDIPTAIGHLHTANSYYQSAKISAVISLLNVAPALVLGVFRIRGLLFRAHREE